MKIYAFVKTWSPDGMLAEVRQRLQATETEMQVVSSSGVYTVAGDQVHFSDRIAGDHVTETLLCRVRDGQDAVFVLDEQGSLKFSQSWEAR